MLETLRVQEFALISELEIDFRAGFNVITGETGAGKSILLAALQLILGGRASSDVVRQGAERASVEAIFRLVRPAPRLRALLEEHDLALEDDALIIRRAVNADGRSKAFVSGVVVPAGVLAAIGDELVDLHGQHEHQSLLKTDRQLALLDAYGQLESLVEEVARQVQALRALEHEIHALENDDRERARHIEFLRFEVNEIDEAAFTIEEAESLHDRLQRVTHAESIAEGAQEAYLALYENESGSSIDLLDRAIRALDHIQQHDTQLRDAVVLLSEARNTIDAVAADLRQYTEGLEVDPEEIETLNRRLTLFQLLKRKYGATMADILAYRDKAEAELSQFDNRDERLQTLRTERERCLAQVMERAEALSAKREKAGAKLEKAVTAALQDLEMKGAQFEVERTRQELNSTGVDRIAFMLAANRGEAMKPLKQVASGGEISRIMLAIKTVFASADRIPTLIFDEIDTGVGGAVARKLAVKLGGLAHSHQVICISHIPQVAAVADTHFTVRKVLHQKRTITQVARVEGEARIEEIARLLDGTVSRVSTDHARSLLDERGAIA
ncbi:MAG: DNA repair protein RecN [Candidatus Hydrogenedentes bacterium]|nr:DNA repair protein RecN [Candidatus Hydrogenedentota bacterium]